jgi:hypothetical protein
MEALLIVGAIVVFVLWGLVAPGLARIAVTGHRT